MMTFQAWLQQMIARLCESDSPRRDAETLLGHVTGRARTWILAFGETTLPADEVTTLEALLQRCQRGEPIAHLVGQREFWPLPLFVSPTTLIPRSDTEYPMEQALVRLPAAPCHTLDLGTGTGAIALALTSERLGCEVTVADVMSDAVALALRNVAHLDIANVTIRQSDWFSAPTGQRLTMIVNNPPHIDAADPHLAEDDARFESLMALVAADRGLTDLVQIIREERQYLLSGGQVLLEHGWTQGEAVCVPFCEAGYLDVVICRDYGDNERLALGCLPDMENVG